MHQLFHNEHQRVVIPPSQHFVYASVWVSENCVNWNCRPILSTIFFLHIAGVSFILPHLNNILFLHLSRTYGVYAIIKLLFYIKLVLAVIMWGVGMRYSWMLCLFIARWVTCSANISGNFLPPIVNRIFFWICQINICHTVTWIVLQHDIAAEYWPQWTSPRGSSLLTMTIYDHLPAVLKYRVFGGYDPCSLLEKKQT